MCDAFYVYLLYQSMCCKHTLIKQIDTDKEDLLTFEK
jgi:hypothetical protein